MSATLLRTHSFRSSSVGVAISASCSSRPTLIVGPLPRGLQLAPASMVLSRWSVSVTLTQPLARARCL